MKPLARILSLLLLVSAVLFYSGCGGGDGAKPSEEATQFEKLKGTWNASDIKLDGVTRTDFPGLKLTVGQESSTYTYLFEATSWPTKSPVPDVKDTFTFVSGRVADQIKRSPDQVIMTYTLSNSNNQLVLAFTIPEGGGFENGRTTAIAGDWTITLAK